MKKIQWGVMSTARIGTEKVIPAMLFTFHFPKSPPPWGGIKVGVMYFLSLLAEGMHSNLISHLVSILCIFFTIYYIPHTIY
jgi:hypothetical protein